MGRRTAELVRREFNLNITVERRVALYHELLVAAFGGPIILDDTRPILWRSASHAWPRVFSVAFSRRSLQLRPMALARQSIKESNVMRVRARSTPARRRKGVPHLVANVWLMLTVMLGAPAHSAPRTDLHHAPNHNFDAKGNFLPGKVGFNLADISNTRQLDALPKGVKGFVWVGQCNGVDATFLKTVQPFVGKSRVFGFYLMDDPDPTGSYKSRCTPDNLKAESDWIHTNIAGRKTFIVLMKLTSSRTPSFINTYNHANSHIDLFGLDPYPCRTELNGCAYEMIDRYVAAADAWGIPRSDIIPIYQAVGGGNWRTDGGGKYILPSVDQLQQMLDHWGRLVPAPVFDYAYSWGSQNADEALEGSPRLQAVFARHNNKF
jgi:hypothetical protein